MDGLSGASGHGLLLVDMITNQTNDLPQVWQIRKIFLINGDVIIFELQCFSTYYMITITELMFSIQLTLSLRANCC